MIKSDIKSPCVQVCSLDARNICVGCGRTLGEIAEWSQASAIRKSHILGLARSRLTLLTADHDRNSPQ